MQMEKVKKINLGVGRTTEDINETMVRSCGSIIVDGFMDVIILLIILSTFVYA